MRLAGEPYGCSLHSKLVARGASIRHATRHYTTSYHITSAERRNSTTFTCLALCICNRHTLASLAFALSLCFIFLSFAISIIFLFLFTLIIFVGSLVAEVCFEFFFVKQASCSP